jgi:integrase
MASQKTLIRSNGSLAHKVYWREAGVQHSMTFDDEYQANVLARFLTANGNNFKVAERAAQQALAEGPTLAESIEDHIRALTGIEDRTREDYRRDARLHLIPQLGHLRTSKLDRRAVREWVNDVHASGAAVKSIANWHALLSATLATAIDEGLRTDHPCKGVRLPQRDRVDDHEKFLEADEYKIVLAQFSPHWRSLLEVLAGTGARWGEVTAFKASDLVVPANGKPAYLRINKAWKKDAKGRPYLSRPKTSRSYRDVTISPELLDLLRSLPREPDDYLLQSPRGGVVTYNYFHQKVWKPALLAAVSRGDLYRIPKIHDLRHSHGSWVLAEGVDMLTVQRRLGHESITTTTNRYGHITERSSQAAADAISRALAG